MYRSIRESGACDRIVTLHNCEACDSLHRSCRACSQPKALVVKQAIEAKRRQAIRWLVCSNVQAHLRITCDSRVSLACWCTLSASVLTSCSRSSVESTCGKETNSRPSLIHLRCKEVCFCVHQAVTFSSSDSLSRAQASQRWNTRMHVSTVQHAVTMDSNLRNSRC